MILSELITPSNFFQVMTGFGDPLALHIISTEAPFAAVMLAGRSLNQGGAVGINDKIFHKKLSNLPYLVIISNFKYCL